MINLGLSLNLSLILCHVFNISYVWPLAIAKFPCFDPNSCGLFMFNILVNIILLSLIILKNARTCLL